MRWDDLFEELEAQFAAAGRDEQEAEIPHLVHAEAASVSLTERIRHRLGHELNVQLRTGEKRYGILDEANHAWIRLRHDRHRYLIPLQGISYVWPLAGAAPRLSGVEAKLTLGYALRKLAESALEVRVVTDGGLLLGRIGMVGSNYCDLHTPTGILAVPWSGIISIEH